MTESNAESLIENFINNNEPLFIEIMKAQGCYEPIIIKSVTIDFVTKDIRVKGYGRKVGDSDE